jgi:hypothetical protein
MDEHFELFERGLRLTSAQKEQIATRFKGVGNSLFTEFYTAGDSSTKRLKIGSHGKYTELQSENGDLDMIFKISQETLERYQAHTSNGPAELLRRARERLQVTYPNISTQHRVWGKVVLIEFATGYNVEVMPAFEEPNGTFTIPNTENDGSWDKYDPRAEMDNIKRSNDETGITRRMIRMVKHWNNNTGHTIKSYIIENLVVAYLDDEYNGQQWSELIEGFFAWLPYQEDAGLSDDALSRISTATNRIVIARDYEIQESYEDACLQWRVVFRSEFPTYDETLVTVRRLENRFPSADEQWIEDRYPVQIDSSLNLRVESLVNKEGWRVASRLRDALTAFHGKLPKSAKVEFRAVIDNASTYNFRWKVRNLSIEAQKDGKLRGKIEPPTSNQAVYKDSTAFEGTHYVECYAIKDGVVVARKKEFVPIGDN